MLVVTERADALMRAHDIALDPLLSKAETMLAMLGRGDSWESTAERDAKLDVIWAKRGAQGETAVEFFVCDIHPTRLDPSGAIVTQEQLYVHGDGGDYLIVLTPDDEQDDGVERIVLQRG